MDGTYAMMRAMTEPPHDVLAAEEFVLPGPDPDLKSPRRLPEDPAGIPEPHDVLAAEEFPMPSIHHPPAQPASAHRRGSVVGLGLLAVLAFRRRRR